MLKLELNSELSPANQAGIAPSTWNKHCSSSITCLVKPPPHSTLRCASRAEDAHQSQQQWGDGDACSRLASFVGAVDWPRGRLWRFDYSAGWLMCCTSLQVCLQTTHRGAHWSVAVLGMASWIWSGVAPGSCWCSLCRCGQWGGISL